MINSEGADRRRIAISLFSAFPIAILGSLIGLGGAEFRLPVLLGPLRHSAREAVPLNLAISLATIITALVVRLTAYRFDLGQQLQLLVGTIGGSVASAILASWFISRLGEQHLRTIVVVALIIIGAALIVEGLFDHPPQALIARSSSVDVGAGFMFGIAVGIFSSALGVAGGELIIPTLLFIFGVDIRTAGTMSLIISAPTVIAGLFMYRRAGAFRQRKSIRETAVPMAAGSVLGALAGAPLLGLFSVTALKIILGVILIASALKTFRTPAPAVDQIVPPG